MEVGLSGLFGVGKSASSFPLEVMMSQRRPPHNSSRGIVLHLSLTGKGQTIGFATTRLLAAVVLSFICVVMVPKRRREPVLSAALIGLGTSVLDQYSLNWINVHAGFLAALFSIPLIAGIVVILPLHSIIRTRSVRLISGSSTGLVKYRHRTNYGTQGSFGDNALVSSVMIAQRL